MRKADGFRTFQVTELALYHTVEELHEPATPDSTKEPSVDFGGDPIL
jgi:hypothetical protein